MKKRLKQPNPSPLNLASRARYDLIDWSKLTKTNITELGNRGHTFLHYIAIHGHWTRLSKELQEFSLTQPSLGNDKIIHLLAKNGRVKQIPKDLISHELMKIPGEGKETVYHLLAENNHTDHIPEILWTRHALTLASETGLTPLHYITHFDFRVLPKTLKIDDFLLSTRNGHTPLHSWAMGPSWKEIPDKYLNQKTLELKGGPNKTLLDILLNQYKNGWASRAREEEIPLVTKFKRIFEKLGDKKLKSLEKDPSPPINILAKQEIAKRKVLKEIKEEESLEF